MANGFTQTPHEILEALARTSLTDYEHRIVHLIQRETYGRHKKTIVLRHSYIATKTRIGKSHIHRTLSSLIERQILISEKVGKQKIAYGLQENWERWKNRHLTRCQTDTCSGVKPTPNEVSVPAHYKDINIKDREFPGRSEGTFPLLGEEKSLPTNPIEGPGSQCPTRIGLAMNQLLKKKGILHGEN